MNNYIIYNILEKGNCSRLAGDDLYNRKRNARYSVILGVAFCNFVLMYRHSCCKPIGHGLLRSYLIIKLIFTTIAFAQSPIPLPIITTADTTNIDSIAEAAILEARWLQDTLALAVPAPLSLVLRHHPETIVIFPNSTAQLGGFELYKKDVFPTYTINGVSTDSAVFWLQSFEIDSIQKVTLQYGQLYKSDTIWRTAVSNGIRFMPRIVGAIDSLKCQPDWRMLPITAPTDVAGWIVFGFIVIILLLVSAKLLYSPYQRWLAKRRLYNHWKKVRFALNEIKSRQLTDPQRMQLVNGVWKAYFDPMLQCLTTAEIAAWLQNETTLDPADQLQLLTLCRTEDSLFYAKQKYPPDVLNAQIASVEATLAREFKRRIAALNPTTNRQRKEAQLSR